MLREKRKSLNLNQYMASNILGISHCYLSKIENRHCVDLKLDLVYKICELYNLDVIVFLKWLKSKK